MRWLLLPLIALLCGCYRGGVFDDDDSTIPVDDDDSTADDDDATAGDDDSAGDDDDSTAGDDDDSTAGDDDDSTPSDFDGDGSPAGVDCDDADPNNYPGNTEVCDGQDNDCDGFADDTAVCPCPVEHWPDDLHPYMFCATETTWFDAQTDCGDSDYRLVTFDSEPELIWTTDTAISYASGQNWWIGFTDQAAEGTWLWEDGSPGTYIDWCGGEPNNSHGGECVGESAENCGMLNWGAGGCWNDYPCSCATIYRICEGVSELRPEQ